MPACAIRLNGSVEKNRPGLDGGVAELVEIAQVRREHWWRGGEPLQRLLAGLALHNPLPDVLGLRRPFRGRWNLLPHSDRCRRMQ